MNLAGANEGSAMKLQRTSLIDRGGFSRIITQWKRLQKAGNLKREVAYWLHYSAVYIKNCVCVGYTTPFAERHLLRSELALMRIVGTFGEPWQYGPERP